MPNTKPLVAAAIICEQILEEKDNVISVVRVVDTYHVASPPELPGGMVPGIEFKLLIALKSGDLTGEHEVRLAIRTPTGKSSEVHKWPVVFRGGEHGVNLKVKFTIPAKDFGLYWFDLLYGDDVLTSIPLKLALGSPRQVPGTEGG